MSDELTTLRAKVKAQGDYIRKLRGERKAMSEQFEGRLAEYRSSIRKLRAQLSAAEDEASASDTFMCGYLLGADQREIGGTDEQHTASMEELGWVRIGRLAQAEGEPSAAEADERDVVPATKYQIALDAARLAARDAERWKRIARDHQGLCKSLKATNEDLLQVIAGMKAENYKLRACLGDGCADCAVGMGKYADSICDKYKAENAKLRERTELLLTLLRREWYIDASWDGLRKFWLVELTEEGVLRKRDAAAAGAGTNTGIEVEDA